MTTRALKCTGHLARPRIRCLVRVFVLVTLTGACSADPAWTRASPVDRPAVIDGHNDLMIHFLDGERLLDAGAYELAVNDGQTDIRRWRAGGVAGSFITVAGSFRADTLAGLMAMLDLLAEVVVRNDSALVLVGSPTELQEATRSGRIGLIPHVEGAEEFGADPSRLTELRRRGVRAVGLVWNHTNAVADAALDSARWGGISPRGSELIRELNRLGIIVDVSHASDAAALQAMRESTTPVVFSHSSARAIADHPRNVPDHILRALADDGGVVMVTFVPYFTRRDYAEWYERGESVWDSLSRVDGDAAGAAMERWEMENPPPAVALSDVADHIEHAVRVAGIDHVGLGSDFDGMYSNVAGLEDAAGFSRLTAELARRGWSPESIEKLTRGNVIRVWQAVEDASMRGRTP